MIRDSAECMTKEKRFAGFISTMIIPRRNDSSNAISRFRILNTKLPSAVGYEGEQSHQSCRPPAPCECRAKQLMLRQPVRDESGNLAGGGRIHIRQNRNYVSRARADF